jgi:hypothetical protein
MARLEGGPALGRRVGERSRERRLLAQRRAGGREPADLRGVDDSELVVADAVAPVLVPHVADRLRARARSANARAPPAHAARGGRVARTDVSPTMPKTGCGQSFLSVASDGRSGPTCTVPPRHTFSSRRCAVTRLPIDAAAPPRAQRAPLSPPAPAAAAAAAAAADFEDGGVPSFERALAQ